MAGKKTGLYLSPIAEEIVNEVAQKFGYTKVSNTVNYIILEYDKLTKEDTLPPTQVVEEEVKKASNLNDWFVSEDKNA